MIIQYYDILTISLFIQVEVEQEAQELRARLKVMDAKRIDDTREIEKLEAQLAEVNHFVAMRPKLQQKIASISKRRT